VKVRKRKRLSKRDRIKVIERDNRTCQACGKGDRILYQEVLDYCKELGTDILPDEMMSRVAELDHIVPFSCGGECAIHNFQTLCGSCNNSKGSLSMEEFMERRKEKGLEVFSI